MAMPPPKPPPFWPKPPFWPPPRRPFFLFSSWAAPEPANAKTAANAASVAHHRVVLPTDVIPLRTIGRRPPPQRATPPRPSADATPAGPSGFAEGRELRGWLNR